MGRGRNKTVKLAIGHCNWDHLQQLQYTEIRPYVLGEDHLNTVIVCSTSV